jgi:O-antigen/teichoic acid export membrane protein
MLFTHSYSKRKKRAIAQTGIKQIGLPAVMLLIYIAIHAFTARKLGATAFGIYMFLQWLVTFTIPLFGIGMSALTSQWLVSLQKPETAPSTAGIFYFLWDRQYRRLLLYALTYLLLTWPLSWIYSISTPLRLLLSLLAALPLFLRGIVDITLRGMRRLDLLALLHTGGALITLALVVSASPVEDKQLETFLLAFAFASIFTLILALICVVQFLPLKGAQLPDIFLRTQLQNSCKNPLLDFVIDTIIWQPGELLLLALWRNPAELGFYMISVFISTSIMHLTPTLMSTLILPYILRRHPDSHCTSTYEAFIKTSCYMAFLAVPICIIVILCSPFIIVFTLGPEYLPLEQPLHILLIASVFGSIATVSLTRLAARGQVKARQYIGASAALVNIILDIPCIAYWGMSGAALASATVQILLTISLLFVCGKSLRKDEIVS